MKILGWVLLVVGLIGAVVAWQSGYGLTGTITMLVVAAIGAWLAFRGEETQNVM
jgi:hypothetical protein